MTTSRVGEVRLRLRIPAELEAIADRLRANVERELLVRVLDELERLLHERLGHAIVIRIRHIALGWRLDVDELALPEIVERLARDIADQICADITAVPDVERLRPRGPRFVVFSSERHADAAWLADRADGVERPWFCDERPDAAATWTAIVEHGTHAIVEVVRWLRAMERLEAAVALAPTAVLPVLAGVAPELTGLVELLHARARGARPHAPATAAVAADGAPPPDRVPPEAEATMAALDARTAVPADLAASEPPGPDAGSPVPRAAEVAAETTEARSVTSRDLAEADRAAIEPIAGALANDGALVLDTDAAGVFYLAGRALEIDLAERLWAAGLPEGDVLAMIANALLGTADDPAARWFGGVFDRAPRPPPVEPWAATEVVETVQHALGRRLVHFDVVRSAAELEAELSALAATVVPAIDVAPLLHRVVSHGAAALIAITCARLDRVHELATVRAMCRRPGRIVVRPDAIHVVMPHHAVDIAYRSAGLDHDPGHVAWLGRRLCFEFVGGEEL